MSKPVVSRSRSLYLNSEYREEIDGLRALAVVPVILFHAGVTGFSGGYIGVDIFFVISGYLISGIILRDLEDATFTISKFYERRVRRLLPALFFVVLCCLTAGFFIMQPAELSKLAESALATLFFYSNFWVFNETGYFAIHAEEMPLLHTWSLSVEEQFYLVFPIFLAFLWRFGKSMISLALGACFCISLLFTQFGSNLSSAHPYIDESFTFNAIPDFAFFYSPFRAFELLAGAMCGTSSGMKKSRLGQFLFTFALGLIVVSFAIFDEATPAPGIISLVPVAGVCLIILSYDKSYWGASLLSSPRVVFLGLISYSAYLIHQPLFAFARIFQMNEPTQFQLLALVPLTFVFAYMVYRWIEQPFRRAPKTNWIGYLFVAAVIATSSIAVIFTDGMALRFSPDLVNRLQAAEDLGARDRNYNCVSGKFAGYEACLFGERDAERKLILLGNSHARMLVPSINNELQVSDLSLSGVHPLQLGSCKYDLPFDVFDVDVSHVSTCLRDWKKMMNNLIAEGDIVVVAHRFTSYIEGVYFDNNEGFRERRYEANDKKLSRIQKEERTRGVAQLLDWLQEQPVDLRILHSVPEVGFSVPKAIFHNEAFGRNINLSTSYEVFIERNARIERVLAADELNRGNIKHIKPSEYLCNQLAEGRCDATDHDLFPYYYDSNHLTPLGSSLFVRDLIF